MSIIYLSAPGDLGVTNINSLNVCSGSVAVIHSKVLHVAASQNIFVRLVYKLKLIGRQEDFQSIPTGEVDNESTYDAR